MQNQREGLYLCTISSMYLRYTQVFNPDGISSALKDMLSGRIEDDMSDEILEIFEDDRSWKNQKYDGYLGVYVWPYGNTNELRAYIAAKHGLPPCVIKVVDLTDECSKVMKDCMHTES